MIQSGKMLIRSGIELTTRAGEKHLRMMKIAAERLTDDLSSVRVWIHDDMPDTVFAECSIPKARQMDVVDRIMHAFALNMEDYSTQSVWFPDPP